MDKDQQAKQQQPAEKRPLKIVIQQKSPESASAPVTQKKSKKVEAQPQPQPTPAQPATNVIDTLPGEAPLNKAERKKRQQIKEQQEKALQQQQAQAQAQTQAQVQQQKQPTQQAAPTPAPKKLSPEEEKHQAKMQEYRTKMEGCVDKLVCKRLFVIR